MPMGDVHPGGVLPIVRLVRSRVADIGKPLREIAAQRGVSYGTLRRYNDASLQPLRTPLRQGTMRELALALDIPLGEVEQAALESVSYRQAPARLESIPTPDGDPLVAYVQGIDGLTPEMRADLLAKFREAVRQAREQASGG